jgi:hypothetical protein
LEEISDLSEQNNFFIFNNDGLETIDPVGVNIDEIKNTDSEEVIGKEEKDFFKKNYKEILNVLDPDSVGKPWYYRFAYSPIKELNNRIEKKIEAGEALDGARDIIPMSMKAAEQKVANAKALRTGTVTEIVDLIGTKEIESKEGLNSIKEEFNSRIKDDKNSFESLYSEFKKNLSLFNEDLSMVDEKNVSKIFSPENNAVISALAKALKEMGVENQSVNSMAGKFEENIEKLLEKISRSEQKIESVKEETPKKEESIEKSESLKTQEKLDLKKSEELQISPAFTEIESSKITETPIFMGETPSSLSPENKVEETKLSSIDSITLSQKPLPVDAFSITATTETPNTNVSKQASDFAKRSIESIFGLSMPKDGEEELVEEGSVDSSPSSLSTYTRMMESIFGPEISSLIPGIGETGEKDKGLGTSQISEKTTKIAEKISPKGETISPGGSVKETGMQKLASPLPTPVPKPPTSTPLETPVSDATKSQGQPSEVSSDEDAVTTPEKSKTQGEQSQTPDTESNNDFSEKLNIMVNLLSQLNETLQNPLIVTPITKNF